MATEQKYGYVKLHDIVLEQLADEQRTTLHKYVWYLHYAISALNKLRMDVDQTAKTSKVEVDTKLKTVKYPEDMIGWIKLGVKQGDRIVGMVNDDSIFREENDKTYVPRGTSYRLINYRDRNLYQSDEIVGWELHPDMFTGMFRDNKEKRRFEFNASFSDQYVYIEYIGSVFDPDTETDVPVGQVDYIKAYIHWRDAYFRYGARHRETLFRKEELKEAESFYKARISDLSIEGILQALQINTTMSTKY